MPAWLPYAIPAIGTGIGALLELFRGGGDRIKSPELDRLLKFQRERMAGQQQLWGDLVNQAFAGMPAYTTAGIRAPNANFGPGTAQLRLGSPPLTGDSNLPEELRRMLLLQENRLSYSDPLYQAVLQMVNRGLPSGQPSMEFRDRSRFPDPNAPIPEIPRPPPRGSPTLPGPRPPREAIGPETFGNPDILALLARLSRGV